MYRNDKYQIQESRRMEKEKQYILTVHHILKLAIDQLKSLSWLVAG